MKQKIIIDIEVKAWNDRSDSYNKLTLSRVRPRSIEFSEKDDGNGRSWTTKIAASIHQNEPLLHDPCIIRVTLPYGQLILGSEEIPCHPVLKEGDMIDFALEWRSKTMPTII